MRDLTPTLYQAATLRFRHHCNILSTGGRGVGKTTGLAMDVIDRCRLLGSYARPLVVKMSWPALQELQAEITALAIAAFGVAVASNKTEGIISLPTGGIIRFSNLESDADYNKHQGANYCSLYADEISNFTPAAWALFKKLRSNVRPPVPYRPHIHLTANPGGKLHMVLWREFVSRAPAFHPFLADDGEYWIVTKGSYKENPHIQHEHYARALAVACGHDEALLAAWLSGSWAALSDMMFAIEQAHIIPALPGWAYNTSIVKPLNGCDWGTSSPAHACLLLQCRQNIPEAHLRAGDIVCADETSTVLNVNDLSKGSGVPPTVFATMIREMNARNALPRVRTVVDDARGLHGETVVDLMGEILHDVRKPEDKNRITHFNLLRTYLHNAKEDGGGPGLFFIEGKCPQTIQSVTGAVRGKLRPEDVDPSYTEDHGLDALVYGLMALHSKHGTVGQATVLGMW